MIFTFMLLSVKEAFRLISEFHTNTVYILGQTVIFPIFGF